MWAKQKGFTIVELLIVIVVIAILAAITIVAFNGIQERANSTSIVSRANAYYKGLRAWEAETGALPTTSTCIAPSSYTTCNVAYWNTNIPVDSAFMSQLAAYSGVASPTLGKYGVNSDGGGVLDSPLGTMAYHVNWYNTGKATLMYTVGPSSDCSLGPLVASDHIALAPSTQKYTIRTSTFTRCEVRLN